MLLVITLVTANMAILPWSAHQEDKCLSTLVLSKLIICVGDVSSSRANLLEFHSETYVVKGAN